MADNLKITIDMNKQCTRCGHQGATDSGYCMKCVADYVKNNPADIRKQVADRVAQEAAQAKQENDGPVIDSELIQTCLYSNSTGDGLLFAEMFRDKFLFIKNTEEWYEWTGHVWQRDKMNRSLAAVEQVALTYLSEYQKLSNIIIEAVKNGADKDETAKLRKVQDKILERVRQLRGPNRRSSCLVFSHTNDKPIAITGEEMDNQPMLFPCANGVIDLETGKCNPGRPSDNLSICSPVEWQGIDAPAPLWEKTLREIFNCDRDGADQSLIDYLQRLFGYSMTGLVQEKVFPVLYGKTGWNGRSLIVETISHILGAFAGSIPSEMLLSQRISKSASGPSPDIMSLKGMRMAFASEIDEGQRFSAAKIKWLTGKDELTGRNPHDKYPTRFNPTHKLFVMTNTLPEAAANDQAFWERMHLIPFDVSFVNRDPQEYYERRANLKLDKELKQESSGILAWLVRGCLLWQQYGLNPPQIIREKSNEYRLTEDILADFIDECCVRESGAEESSSKLYNRFITWFEVNHGKKVWSGTKFGKQLGQKYTKRKSNGKYVYQGVALAQSSADIEV